MDGNELFRNLLYGIESIWGPVAYPREFPKFIKETKACLISSLYPAISFEKRRDTRPAALYLFPLLKHTPINFPLEEGEVVPQFPCVMSIFSFWAVMLDDEFQTLVRAIALNRPDLLDKYIDYPGAKPLIADRDQARLNIAQGIIDLIYSRHRQMIRREVSIPVEIMDRREMKGIVGQFNKCDPQGPYYNESYHLHIRVDVNHDIESIVSAFRKIVEDQHTAMKELHQQNWSDSEREFYGEKYIEACNPIKEFTYKEPGSKSRTEQSFVDDVFHALLVYELRLKKIKPVDIERRFFGLQDDSTTGAYNAATTKNKRLKALAERIIDNALSGAALQS